MVMVLVVVVLFCQQMHLSTASFAMLCHVLRTTRVDSTSTCTTRGDITTFLVRNENDNDDDDNGECNVIMGRNRFVVNVASSAIMTLFATNPKSALAGTSTTASYSTNARNMERLALGDLSGGSVYDNNPKTEASKKRRALQGCKVPSARRVAAAAAATKTQDNIISQSQQQQQQQQSFFSLTEKDCNMKVMAGETEFMLQAIRTLECPTCPYGIDPK